MDGEPADRLDSWKEIAAYLNRSVRTVRRWERDEGLPVHRHIHNTLGSVYAQKSELDAWQRGARRSTNVALPNDEKSIAVLPFANLSVEPENEYFADGLTEEVTINLSKVRALRVTSRMSSRALRASSKGAAAIAAQLGVGYILEGSVRRAGDRLRITAQLIDAAADANVWAETFDGTVEDVFEIQERIARIIVDALKVRLTPDEVERLGERAIDNLPAYECYLRARHELWRWRKEPIDHAVELLEKALAIIGDNARLYATLGLAWLQYREAGIDFTERPLHEAERCSARVFELDPASAAGLLLRGWIHYSRGRIRDAVDDLEDALQIEPNNPDVLLLLANCNLISGRVDVARPLIARLLAIDPLTPLTRCMPAFADLMEGNIEAALEPYQLMLDMDPANPVARLFYIWVLIFVGRFDDVGAIAARFSDEVRETLAARIAMFLAHAVAGNRREALASLPAEIESIATASDVFPRLLAHGHTILGMRDEALRWMRIAIDRGFINYPFLSKHDPVFERWRDDADFRALLEGVRERWTAFATG